jgi:hypothetical protein
MNLADALFGAGRADEAAAELDAAEATFERLLAVKDVAAVRARRTARGR